MMVEFTFFVRVNLSIPSQRLCDIGLTDDNIEMPEEESEDDEDWDSDEEDRRDEERKQLKIKLQEEARLKVVGPWLETLWKTLEK
jgi:hypothetical protein